MIRQNAPGLNGGRHLSERRLSPATGCPNMGTPRPLPAAMMSDFTVIAHRGASAYLPESTLAAAAVAHAMRADYIELDVVLTRDDVPVVLHDLYLDAVTDVAGKFPGRRRPDGHHYAIDFNWAEICSLRVHERTDANGSALFPNRFPFSAAIFHLPSLAEMVELVQGLNHASGWQAGFYIEPKSPAFHHAAGKDVTAAVLRLLAAHGLCHGDDKVCIQSFDREELRRARLELQTPLTLVQLIGENDWNESPTDFEHLQTAAGLAAIADFADGIGPWLPQVIEIDATGTPRYSGLVGMAHARGLFVHAYTLRADQLPQHVADLKTALQLLRQAGLDGVFTDHPDRVRGLLSRFGADGLSG